jgi:hypothetical protein
MQKFHFISVEINIYGLSYECPYVIRKVSCPLKKIDSLSFQKKVDWVDELSEERKRSIWEQHILCSQIRNSESFSVINNVVK